MEAAKLPERSKGLVLIVEDDLETAHDMMDSLAAEFECEWVALLDEALERLSLRKFDVIVTDFRLPYGNGLELLNRALELYPDVSGVLVTGRPDDPELIQVRYEQPLRGVRQAGRQGPHHALGGEARGSFTALEGAGRPE